MNQRTQCYPPAVQSVLIFLALLCFATPCAVAATLEITVADTRGTPLVDAVVSAHPRPGPAPK